MSQAMIDRFLKSKIKGLQKKKYKGDKMQIKKLLLMLAVGLFAINTASAKISVILEDDINFNNSNGTINTTLKYGNETISAIGRYSVNTQTNEVTFTIEKLMQGQRMSMLDKYPKVTRKLKDTNSVLPKGSKLTLSGEDSKEFQSFVKTLQQAKSDDNSTFSDLSKKKNTSVQKGSLGSSGASSSAGGSSAGSFGNSQINPPYLTPTTNAQTSVDDNGNITTTYSANFCQVPEFKDNSVALYIIDKDGSCVEKTAVRDDTKCEYRYDFANNVAIKQTQFYYVDNEAKTQMLGDCVDLVGEEYRAQLYKDDTRCSLEHIDKDYRGGRGSFFVTQILFRGIDGLIHEATDCIAYGNVQEELIDYEHTPASRFSQRIVNQYYIDPYTDETVYLTKGVKTASQFQWVESSCGDWEMDDTLLRGKKRTQIEFFDEVGYEKVPVTSCDFSVTEGKKSEYVIAYNNLSATYKEKELSRRNSAYSLTRHKAEYYQSSSTGRSCDFLHCWTYGSNAWSHRTLESGKYTKWNVNYVTKDVTDYETYMRPDGTIYQKNANPNGETFTRIDREVVVTQNDWKLNESWLLYWEIHKGYYDPVKSNMNNYDLSAYNNWVANKYVNKTGINNEWACQNYSFYNQNTGSPYVTCNTPLFYVLTN